MALGDLGQANAELSSFDEIIDQYSDNESLEVRREVAITLARKATLLADRGEPDRALAVHDDIIGRYGDASDSALRLRLAAAMYNKGKLLEYLGRETDALAVYRDASARFAVRETPEIDRLTRWMRRQSVRGRLRALHLLSALEAIGRFSTRLRGKGSNA